MKRLLPFIFFILMVLATSACDPFKADQIHEQAIADQIAAQTQQEALNAEQARQHAAALEQFQLQEAARLQSRKDALEPVVRLGLQMVTMSLFMVAALTIIYGGVTVVPKAVVQFNRLQEGSTTAVITKLDISSRLISLDPNTRQYPLIYQYNGHGRYLVTDVNTKVTMELDTRNEGDAQMIAGAVAIRHTGMVVMEQRKSGAKDAASMSLAQPPVIEGTAIDVKTIARDLVGKGGWDDE